MMVQLQADSPKVVIMVYWLLQGQALYTNMTRSAAMQVSRFNHVCRHSISRWFQHVPTFCDGSYGIHVFCMKCTHHLGPPSPSWKPLTVLDKDRRTPQLAIDSYMHGSRMGVVSHVKRYWSKEETWTPLAPPVLPLHRTRMLNAGVPRRLAQGVNTNVFQRASVRQLGEA